MISWFFEHCGEQPGGILGQRLEDRGGHVNLGVAERLAGTGLQLAHAHVSVGRPIVRPKQFLGHRSVAPTLSISKASAFGAANGLLIARSRSPVAAGNARTGRVRLSLALFLLSKP